MTSNADSTASPLPPACDAAEEDEEVLDASTTHWPLEGGPPRVVSRSRAVCSGVSKQLIARGSGAPPTRDCKCFVHFQAWNAGTGEEVENTREGREASQLILGKEPSHRQGLCLALLSMLPGERALVRVSSAGAYGEEGSFSFPSVAPGAELLYDLQLLSVERPGERSVRARGDMVWEERMAEAARYRDAGNAHFRADRVEEAQTEYQAGLTYVDDGMMAQLMGHYLDESSALKGSLHLNLAACGLRLGAAEEALAHARAALALQPASSKALYRMGRAHAALGQDEAAREALQRAAKLDAGDAAVRAALRELDAEEARKAVARKGLFGGLFGPAHERAAVEALSSEAPPPPPPPSPRSPGLLGRLLGY